MNIFATSPCPVQSAKYLDDKRVIKMCLETAQLLSTAIHIASPEEVQGIYKATHKGHPCTKWTALTKQNYEWTMKHFVALCDEYTERYGKVHASLKLLPLFSKHAGLFPSSGLTPFANCCANKELNVCYKHIPDVHKAYQLYLADRWDNDKRTPTWHGLE